jgi:hypothetical protein
MNTIPNPGSEGSGGDGSPTTGDTPGQTDNSQLVTSGPISVSPDGGSTDEPFPKPDVEYDFCVSLANAGKLPSGPFFVRFTLSGDQDPPLDLDFQQDAGLAAGSTTQGVVHYGKFPNTFAVYHLTACIYSNSAPETAINCAGAYDITINSESASDSGSGGSN